MNRWFKLSTVRARSAVWLVVLLIPPLLVAFWIQVEWRRHERSDTAADAMRLAGHAAALHFRLIDGSRQWLAGASSTLASLPADEAAVRRVLAGRLEAEPQYLNAGVIDPQGTILVSGRPITGPRDVTSHAHFRRALETRAFTAGDYEEDEATGRSTFTVAAPVLDAAGGVSHVLFAVVRVAWLEEFPREAQLPEGTVLAVINGTGEIVLHEPDPRRWLGRSVPQAVLAHFASAPQAAIDAISEDGIERLYGVEAVGPRPADLYVAVGIPKAIATVKAGRLLLLTFAAFGLAGLLTVTMAVVGAEVYFLGPLTMIVQTTKRLRGGDLSARSGLPRRGDELHQLATSVDEMAAALEQAHERLEARVQERTAELVLANAALETEIASRARVERSVRKLSLAIEQTADCVLITDSAGVVEYVNPAFEAMTGYSREEAVGAKPSLVKSGRHSEAFYARLWQKIAAGEVYRSVFINRRKDGQLYYEDKTISPIRDTDGRVTHHVSTGRDITHRKRTEEALRRLNEQLEHEAKRIASALHDASGGFLTAAYITLADVVRDLPPETGERLRDVRRNLDQVEEQLRRLSHELRPRVLDDHGLPEALKFLANGVSRRTGVAISVQASLDGRYPPAVETAIYRMVQEALTNITRHAGASQATVVLEEEGQTLLCSIQDDGHGFEVSAISHAGAGGLGLVGIQDRLEAVGGTLEIVSMPGGGTELRTAVPLEALDAGG